MKINITTHVYFNQKNFDDTKLLLEFYENANNHLTENIEYSDFITNSKTESFVAQYGGNILTLLKMILLEKKVVIYSKSAGKVSQFIIGILTLFPG